MFTQEGHMEAWHHGYSNSHQQSEQHQRCRTFIRGGKRGKGDGDIRGRGRGGSRGRSRGRGRGRGSSRGSGKSRGGGYGRGRGAFRGTPWEAQMSHMPPPPLLMPDNDPCEEDDEEEDDDCTDDGDEFTVRAKTRIMPLGPFNEGVPTSFPAAVPPGFHRGMLCQQPVSVPARRVADDDALDIAVIMGQEVEDLASEKDPTVGSNSSGGNKKTKMKKKDRDILDHALRSRVNLPAMQFVNRDKREIDALARCRNVSLPRNPSRNDLSDDEVADLRDFEVPFTDLEADTVPLERRLSGTLKEGVVLNRRGELICDDARLPPSSFLQCHMCDKRGFTHLSLYKEHLAGDMHERLRAMHVATLQAGLAYLRAAAKKAEIRLAMGLLRSSADPSTKLNNFCDVCGCNVLESRLHTQLPQHRLVEKFLFPVCCGEKFRNRVEFEDHRTCPAHLRELFKERLALAHRLQQGRLKGEERYQSLPEYLRLLKANCLVVDDDSNTANLTPYDPSRPNVVKLLKYHGRVQCLCCGDTFGPHELEQLYEHVHSLEHYEAAVLYTTQREREAVHSSVAGDEEQVRRVARRCRTVLGVAAALVEDARLKASSPAGHRRVQPPPAPPPAGAQMGVELVGGEPVSRGDAQMLEDRVAMTGVTLSEDDVAMAAV